MKFSILEVLAAKSSAKELIRFLVCPKGLPPNISKFIFFLIFSNIIKYFFVNNTSSSNKKTYFPLDFSKPLLLDIPQPIEILFSMQE